MTPTTCSGARVIERHLPVTTRPTSGQDRQTQPLTMAPSRVAEQNRAAITSWLAGLCGHTTHASLSVASAPSSIDDARSRCRTSAKVVREMESVEDVMAEGPDSTAERRDSGKSVPALPWRAVNEE